MKETAANKPRILVLASHSDLLLAASLLVLCGCNTIAVRQANWGPPTTYQEEWTIRTEPAGCKIYFNEEYVGDSPLTTKVNGGEVLVSDFLGQNENLRAKASGDLDRQGM